MLFRVTPELVKPVEPVESVLELKEFPPLLNELLPLLNELLPLLLPLEKLVEPLLPLVKPEDPELVVTPEDEPMTLPEGIP